MQSIIFVDSSLPLGFVLDALIFGSVGRESGSCKITDRLSLQGLGREKFGLPFHTIR